MSRRPNHNWLLTTGYWLLLPGYWLLPVGYWLLLSTGCGGGHPAEIHGTVTLDGLALTKGTVTYHPVEKGPAAYGQIGDDGRYTIRTGTTAGLAPGRYKITVVATDPPPPGDEENPGTLLTPARYGNLQETDLQRDVQAGDNAHDLELTSK